MKTTLHARRGPDTLTVEIEGQGPGLLILHGLLGDKDAARQQAPAGHRVATYDQRGHGDGPRHTSPSAYEIDEFVADALAVLDGLEATGEPEWSRPNLAGTSMGAAVALRLALDHPGRISTLMLAGPAFSDEPSPAIERFDALADGLDEHGIIRYLPILRGRMEEAGGIAPDPEEMERTWSRHDVDAIVAAIRTVGHWQPFPDLDKAAALDVPVVTVGWPDDPMHPLELAERISALSGGPLARLSGVGEVLSRPGNVGEALNSLRTANPPSAAEAKP